LLTGTHYEMLQVAMDSHENIIVVIVTGCHEKSVLKRGPSLRLW
jgi:hypothetical protein